MISTHVLDVSRGRPASGVSVTLERLADDWQATASASTDGDGRVRELVTGAMLPGTYRLTFDTRTYFDRTSTESFYPSITVAFEVKDASQHYHVPLLLSPYGYSTYRGT